MNGITAQDFIAKRPHLIWFTTNYNRLSNEAILEAVLNYGTWQDVQDIESILTLPVAKQLYNHISTKTRSNLRPAAKNYFDLYYNVHK